MDSDDENSAPMELDLDASDKDLGSDRHPEPKTLPTAQDLDKSKTSDTSTTNNSQTTTGTNKDHTTSSTAKGNASKTSETKMKNTNQKTTGAKKDMESSSYDKDFIRQVVTTVFQCRSCDFEHEDLVVVKRHVEVHKKPGPSKPAWWPTSNSKVEPKGAKATLKEQWLRDFNSEENFPFKFVSEIRVRCLLCEMEFDAKQRSPLKRHANTKSHQANTGFKEDRRVLQEESEICSRPKSDNGLAKDLCKMAVAANLAWNVFNNPIVREILQKHIGKTIPSAPTVAKQLDQCYEEVMGEIKRDLHGKPFWLAVDETNGMIIHMHFNSKQF